MADQIINFEFRVGGTLTDPTSVVLSDPTGTYGVKRNDTSAVVVADGTAMTKQSVGIYQYTFTEPAASLTYTAYIEFVYDGATYHFERPLTGADAAGVATTTLETARSLVTDAVMQWPASRYTNTQIDHAIKMAGDEFVRKTRCARTTATTNLTADQNQVSFSAVADFTPERLILAEADHATEDAINILKQVDYAYVRRLIENQEHRREHWESSLNDVDHSGLPTHIGFRNRADAYVYPEPDAAHTLKLVYFAPFTDWTPGTASPGDVTLNIPDDMIYGVLWWGAPAILEHTSTKARYQSESYRRFQEHIRDCRGVAGGGGGILMADEREYD